MIELVINIFTLTIFSLGCQNMPFADNVFISFMFLKFAGYNLPVKKNKGETF